jgi:1-deoxy-D-xylulose 5-phosphate reductoisomerase
MYPKEDKENYQVMQFASQAAGGQGLATYVQQAAETAIKVAHCLHSHISFKEPGRRTVFSC